MEKLQKYNQILLAALGTVVLIWGVSGLIYVAFDIWSRSSYEELAGIIPDSLIEHLQHRLDGREN